jgi:hypothetical protein
MSGVRTPRTEELAPLSLVLLASSLLTMQLAANIVRLQLAAKIQARTSVTTSTAAPLLFRLPVEIHEEIFFNLLFSHKSEDLHEVEESLKYYQDSLHIRVNEKVIMRRVAKAHIDEYQRRLAIIRRKLVLNRFQIRVWKAVRVLEREKYDSHRFRFKELRSDAVVERRELNAKSYKMKETVRVMTNYLANLDAEKGTVCA